MYYLIIIAVVLFGVGFATQDVYRKMRGDNLKISLQFALIGSIAGFIVLFAYNKFRFEFTPFTLLMSFATAISGIAFTFCSFKALGIINLSLYSVFSMLGGMLLPFVQGIALYGEKMTVAKGVCLVLITAALALTIEKGGNKKAILYYLGVFMLNGASGVIAKFFTEGAYAKTSATGFSVLSVLCLVLLCAVLLPFFPKKKHPTMPITWTSSAVAAANGIINKVANLLLVFALATVDASVQYPMVTGGVMIVSTAICYLQRKKPTVKELCSVALAFLGTLALFLIPV